jgi:hypothetical protein
MGAASYALCTCASLLPVPPVPVPGGCTFVKPFLAVSAMASTAFPLTPVSRERRGVMV